MSGYPQTLKYFMWPWQVYFRILSQNSAKNLFGTLDRGLRPNVFLIGFLVAERNDRHPICIDPEIIDYTLDEFENLQDVANELYRNSDDSRMFYTGSGMQEEMDNRHREEYFRRALEKILNESQNNTGKICFVSPGVIIAGYKVFVILELNKSVYELHTHLKRVDPMERMKKYFSFLEATKDVFLNTSALHLHLPDPGKSLSSDVRTSEEIFKRAALRFMHSLAWAGRNINDLFDSCNEIATTLYEGGENYGHLIIAEPDHPDIDMKLSLEAPFGVHDYRKARKFLQLSDRVTGVIYCADQVLGLGRITSNYDPETESIFSIRFKGFGRWEVKHNDLVLMKVKNGVPRLPQEVINKAAFFADAKRIFGVISNEKMSLLYELSLATTKQKKGAMLIITKEAENEALRLKSRCIPIKPIKLDATLLINLTSIDGGVLINPDGVVYAHGVILDGIVGDLGDPARGSRYNAAITYQENQGLDKPTMIVVVSEDGMVDILPTYIPKIRHSAITEVISILERLTSASTFNRGQFYEAMEWLKNRQFYLTLEECEKINELKDQLTILDKESEEHTMWIIHQDVS
ncbi:MAG: hypothetical protein AAFZ63_27390, partial [Bacteroidota bacterium]